MEGTEEGTNNQKEKEKVEQNKEKEGCKREKLGKERERQRLLGCDTFTEKVAMKYCS